jgi:DNA-binding transcriptional MocR family regulator
VDTRLKALERRFQSLKPSSKERGAMMKNHIRFVYESHNPLGAREEQRDAVFRAARQHFPHVVSWISPQGNAPLWVILPLEIDPRELLRLSEQEGVAFIPGPVAHGERNTAILHFSHLEPNEIEEGIKRLGGLIVKYMDLASRTNGVPSSRLVGP